MEIFIYEGNELAIIKKDDDIWFRAKTVANILKYSNQRKAIIDHVDSEDKCSLNEPKPGSLKLLPIQINDTIMVLIVSGHLFTFFFVYKPITIFISFATFWAFIFFLLPSFHSFFFMLLFVFNRHSI